MNKNLWQTRNPEIKAQVEAVMADERAELTTRVETQNRVIIEKTDGWHAEKLAHAKTKADLAALRKERDEAERLAVARFNEIQTHVAVILKLNSEVLATQASIHQVVEEMRDRLKSSAAVGATTVDRWASILAALAQEP